MIHYNITFQPMPQIDRREPSAGMWRRVGLVGTDVIANWYAAPGSRILSALKMGQTISLEASAFIGSHGVTSQH
jgi:hypothetical protein